ncbi:ATP-binding protein OS=Streptomyces rimosus subsp. rimosus (strain ATCC / DSM 40260 / JCM 4667/ NRRL 2234) OX=1265868 GN=SRIM_026380 PE=4 SV=1 [Streptomyces rimosus subsp. rimosus]
MPRHASHPRHPAHRHGNWEQLRRLPDRPLSPGIARTTAHSVLTATRSPNRDLARLLASELATNRYLHAPGPARMRLSWRTAWCG